MVPTFGENCSLSSRDPVAGRVSVCWRPVRRNQPLEARNARADAEPGWRGIGPTTFFASGTGETEGEMGSATFLAVGHCGSTEGEMGGMGPPIFFTAALARPRVK